MDVERIIWREHAKGPGVLTLLYVDGGHDHREASQYETRSLAQGLGLTALHDRPEYQEWIRR